MSQRKTSDSKPVKYRIYTVDGWSLLELWSFKTDGFFIRRMTNLAKFSAVRSYTVSVENAFTGKTAWFRAHLEKSGNWELRPHESLKEN